MRGFEPPTSRPPDVYSNRTELHPEFIEQKYYLLFIYKVVFSKIMKYLQKLLVLVLQ